MLVYVSGPLMFIVGVASLMVALIIVFCMMFRQFSDFHAASESMDVSVLRTREVPAAPKKIWQRTASPVGDELTTTCEQRIKRPVRLVSPETPVPLSIFQPAPPRNVATEPLRIARVTLFGNWVASYDQFGAPMPFFSGLRDMVEPKIRKVYKGAWEEVDSAGAVQGKKRLANLAASKQLADRMANIREMSPVQ